MMVWMGQGSLRWILYAVAVPAALTLLGRIEEHFHIGDLLAGIAVHWRTFFRTLWSDFFSLFDVRVSPLATDMLTFAGLVVGTQITAIVARLTAAPTVFEPKTQVGYSAPEMAQTEHLELSQAEERRRLVLNTTCAVATFAIFFFGPLSAALEIYAPETYRQSLGRYLEGLLSIGDGSALLLIYAVLVSSFAPYFLARHRAVFLFDHLKALMPLLIFTVAVPLVLFDEAASAAESSRMWTLIAAALMLIAVFASIVLHSDALARILIVVLSLGAASVLVELLTPIFDYLTQVLLRSAGT